MKILFIGGTGIISSACAELAVRRGHDLFLLNRSESRKYPVAEGAHEIVADVHGPEQELSKLLSGYHFDAVVDFIAFTEQDIQRDFAPLPGQDRTIRIHKLCLCIPEAAAQLLDHRRDAA